MPAISDSDAKNFERWSELIRPSLESRAARAVGQDFDTVAQEAIFRAWKHRASFNFDDGQPGLFGWLHDILGHCIEDWYKARRRDADLCERCALDGEFANSHKWDSLLFLHNLDQAEDVTRRARLTKLQRDCFNAYLSGWDAKEAAKLIGVSVSSVYRNSRAAIIKLREFELAAKAAVEDSEPASEFLAPDMDARRWKARNWSFYVDLRYFPPPKTGTGMARIDLKNASRSGGSCSVTRKEDIR